MTGPDELIGATVVCVASGPSLSPQDCQTVKESGHPVVAVNNSWEAVPWCRALYASDHGWWRTYARAVTTQAERWTNNARAAREYGPNLFECPGGDHAGLCAIRLAHWWGAARIVLLGYDCQPQKAENGAPERHHWHAPHTRCSNPIPRSFRIWKHQHMLIAEPIRAKIVNCSRVTALRCYKVAPLEASLG